MAKRAVITDTSAGMRARTAVAVLWAWVLALGGGVAGAVQAQQAGVTFHGRVVDARTGVPVPGALVRVLDTTVSAESDADGAFQLGGVPAAPVTV